MSPEFLLEYRRAEQEYPRTKQRQETGNTLQSAIDLWRQSSDWNLKATSTKRQRESLLRPTLAQAGQMPIRAISRQHIVDGRERRQATPAAANNFLKTMKAFFRWAIEVGLVKIDPTEGVRSLRLNTHGFRAWNDKHIQLFRDHWPIGSRERLAFELLYHTGLRRSDLVKLGPMHVRDGVIEITAQKNGVTAYIPMTPEIQTIIEASATGAATFFCSLSGAPMTKESFGNFFREACDKAKVDRSSHGLRKTKAINLGDKGASELALQATLGWSTNQQSQVYTKGFNRRRLAMSISQKQTEKEIPRTFGELPAPQNYTIENKEEILEQNDSGGPTRTRTWNQTVMSRQL